MSAPAHFRCWANTPTVRLAQTETLSPLNSSPPPLTCPPGSHYQLSVSVDLASLGPPQGENHTVFLWLASLSIMSTRSKRVVAGVRFPSFSRRTVSSEPQLCLPIHLRTDACEGSTSWLIGERAAVNVGVRVSVFSSLGLHPGVELLAYMVILCLIFLRTPPYCFPQQSYSLRSCWQFQGLRFLQSFADTCTFLFVWGF